MQIKPEIIRLTEVDSTNRYALVNFDALADCTLIAADAQTAGKGRQGKAWFSTPGENICASFVMKNVPSPISNASIIASLAALEMLRANAHNAKFWIKWPNDIYCGMKKIAGILCEGRPPSGVIAGIGININMPQSSLDAIDQPATSLAVETGRSIELKPAVAALAESLCKYYVQYSLNPSGLHQLWKHENLLIGKDIELVDGRGKTLSGKILDIGESGEIYFETGGKTLKLYSGDIRIRKESLSCDALFHSQ
jgi:BirA family biotin operon repressor/biotin-[acetyl-CoA-carboxylase] ligase